MFENRLRFSVVGLVKNCLINDRKYSINNYPLLDPFYICCLDIIKTFARYARRPFSPDFKTVACFQKKRVFTLTTRGTKRNSHFIRLSLKTHIYMTQQKYVS